MNVLLQRTNGMVSAALVRFLASTARLQIFVSLAEVDIIITASQTLASRFVQEAFMLFNSSVLPATLCVPSALMAPPIA